MKKWIVFFVFFWNVFNLIAQPYMEGKKTRHRFAQLNLGMDTRIFSSQGSYTYLLDDKGIFKQTKMKSLTESRIIIGGTHFWGHADFYIAIPFVSFGKSNFRTSVETGAKFFPWKIENKIRPYIGSALLPIKFQQGIGVEIIRYKTPILTGVVYYFNKQLLEIGMGYTFKNKENYYFNEKSFLEIDIPKMSFSISYKYMMETTLSSEKNWKNGSTQKTTEKLAALNKLNGFTIAFGPSSTFFLNKSKDYLNQTPFLDKHKSTQVFGDFGIGYYFHKPDIQLNFAYRRMKSMLEAYQYTEILERKSLAFEAYKFVLDYHGFAMFAGATIGFDNLKWQQKNPKNEFIKAENNRIKPGFILGWDIRPNRLQTWYLRTNIRYFPNLSIDIPQYQQYSFSHLEFNFIQLVIFPGRFF